MIIEVELDKNKKKIELPDGSVVETVLASLDLHPDAFIAIRGGTPIPLTAILVDKDKVRLIRVASGG